ncbi:ATP-binding cassette domain-containing protein [Lysinibacillus sp. NPDC093688]|uniref:ATP-binding cassette domain-containing protein n=1 Tax=Lysinibacillus sp. NPDC093688 TaxID=3390577 RepID=UPI003CFE4B05
MQDYNVKVENLTKNYGKKAVLKGIDFTAKKGEIIGVIGKNGAGKSTFLENLMTIKDYNDGKVIVFGNNLQKNNEQLVFHSLPLKNYIFSQMFRINTITE